MATYITSDLHLQHIGALKWRTENVDVRSADADIVDRINSVCGKSDSLVMIGDITGPTVNDKAAYAKALNDIVCDKIYIIPGNHDYRTLDLTMSILGRRAKILPPIYERRGMLHPIFIMSHYPLESWNGQGYGVKHYHGHSHGHARQVKNRFDVSIIESVPTPISLELSYEDYVAYSVGYEED